jgi:hypothetical protein
MHSKVGLCPTALAAKSADPTTQSNADIDCHTDSMAVFFRLQIAYRVQSA